MLVLAIVGVTMTVVRVCWMECSTMFFAEHHTQTQIHKDTKHSHKKHKLSVNIFSSSFHP